MLEGFGALIAAKAAGLEIFLECAVTRIDYRCARPRVETTKGSLSADAVILTVPSSLIAAQRIQLRPEAPDKIQAACALPLGLANKLAMTIDAPQMLPIDGHVFGDPDRTATGSYHLRPFGRPMIEGFFGGRLAHDLEAAGPMASFDFALSELENLLGSAIRSRLHFVAKTEWGRDPFARPTALI